MSVDSLLLDLSNHDDSTFNAPCFYNSGVRRAIVAGERSTSRSQVDRLQAAGIEVIGLYAYLYWIRDPWGSTPIMRTRAACNLAREKGIPMVWLDAEDTTNGNVGQRVHELNTCVRYVQNAGLKVGIYTAAWFWRPYMGDSKEFSHLPLWNANYTEGRVVPTANYGGWTDVAIHQYTSSRQLCGRVRDHNHLLDASVAGQTKEEPEDDGMKAEEVEALIAAKLAPLALRVLEAEQKYDELVLRSYGTPARLAKMKDHLPLEERVNRMEQDDGWLGKKLENFRQQMVELAVERGVTSHHLERVLVAALDEARTVQTEGME